MEMKCQRYDITDVDVLNIFYIQKRCSIWKKIFCNVNNGMQMYEFKIKTYAP
jgi:hypothetical protein